MIIRFWKFQADRKKLLEQMKNLWNNKLWYRWFRSLHGSDGRGASRGVCRKKSVMRNTAMIFIVFSILFAVHREELHTDTEV